MQSAQRQTASKETQTTLTLNFHLPFRRDFRWRVRTIQILWLCALMTWAHPLSPCINFTILITLTLIVIRNQLPRLYGSNNCIIKITVMQNNQNCVSSILLSNLKGTTEGLWRTSRGYGLKFLMAFTVSCLLFTAITALLNKYIALSLWGTIILREFIMFQLLCFQSFPMDNKVSCLWYVLV